MYQRVDRARGGERVLGGVTIDEPARSGGDGGAEAAERLGDVAPECRRRVGHEHRTAVEHAWMLGHGFVTQFELGVHGKTVVVAGAGGGGIGTAVCAMLVASGATVLGFDVDRDALSITERAVGDDAARFVSSLVDVTDASSVDAALEAVDELPPLLGLVHVVGGMPFADWSSVTGMPPAVFAAVVDLNLQSAFVTTQAVARRLVDQGGGGSIVLVSSISGLSAMPFGAPYAAAKAGVLALDAHRGPGARSPRRAGERGGPGHDPHRSQRARHAERRLTRGAAGDPAAPTRYAG